MRTQLLKIITFAILTSSLLANAGTNGFILPFFRGSPSSQAGYWETFTAPAGAPGNLADRSGATTSAVLTQSDTNAFLTGSGNIYNLSGVSSFTLAGSTPFALGTVVLQTRTLGGEIDYAGALLHYTNESGAQTLTPVTRVELNRGSQPGLGATVSSLWQWDLSGMNVSTFSISFRAAAISCSFDSLTLDTWDQFAPLFAAPFVLNNTAPAIERWMYANNASPCDRPAGSVFATFGDASNVDTRHAQQLIGWDTAALVPTNRGPARYLVSKCRITLTINRGNLFAYDPTHDALRTYFDANSSGYLADSDIGRPLELFGVGFRHGYTAASFDQCASFGTNAPAQRNAYAAGFSTNGILVDVSNNVGKTNTAYPAFEVAPFAIGHTTDAQPGQLVPAGAKITFDLNLNDPLVLGYLQAGLNLGRLRFMISSLHANAGQLGAPSYPDFATHFNEAALEPTRIEIEGLAIGSGDMDADGLPDDWEISALGTLTYSASGDADGDGASNGAELRAGTNPQSNASTLRTVVAARQTNGTVTLRFLHAPSRRYAIEFSDKLPTWQRITNAPLLYVPPGSVQWTDDGSFTGGLNAERFYRIAAE